MTTSTFERNRTYSRSRGYRVIYGYSVGGADVQRAEPVDAVTPER